jgi:hypothetical protein
LLVSAPLAGDFAPLSAAFGSTLVAAGVV